MLMRIARSAAILMTLACIPLAAQAPAPVPLATLPADVVAARFDVVSIKVNRSGDARVLMGGGVRGRYTATNVPLATLIRAAYRLQASQLEGLPDWATSTRFDVVATIPEGPPSPARQLAMLRNMLTDRFKLTSRTAVREQPLYALLTARADGRLGDKMKVASADCAAINSGRGAGTPPAPGALPPCGMMLGPGRMTSSGQAVGGIIGGLNNFVDRLIVDRTALKDFYEFELVWTPEQFAGRGGRDGGPIIANGFEIDPNGPGLFTAIQEQLGLKLEPVRGPVEVMVIDRLEQPTED